MFASKWEEGGGVFCVCFHDFESGGEDGGEGGGFFHSSQNEKICGDLVGLLHFTKIPLCMHFILIYKIKYYINLFIISKIFNYTINNNI